MSFFFRNFAMRFGSAEDALTCLLLVYSDALCIDDAMKKTGGITKEQKFIGTLCGVGAAVCYGTNPLGALNLYAEGMTTNCVLFYRFGLAWLVMCVVMALRKESLRVTRKEFMVVSALGILFIFSSLTLYLSFHLMPAGVASTILFTYPIMTVLIMLMGFGEKANLLTWGSIALATAGVVLLYWTGEGQTLNTWGVVLVLVSALTYALYIVIVGKARLECSSFKINWYVLLWCAVGMLVYTAIGNAFHPGTLPLALPHTVRSWFFVAWLAVVPGIGALVMMVYSSKWVGATPTAILGALEPLTAVVIGIFVFSEPFSGRLALGIVLILVAVVLVAWGKELARRFKV